MITDFIFTHDPKRTYSKFKETEKATCFTYDFKGFTKNCSCRMAGCYHKSHPYTKRFYVWIPKSVLSKHIMKGANSRIADRRTVWLLNVPPKYMQSTFSHFLKKEDREKAA